MASKKLMGGKWLYRKKIQKFLGDDSHICPMNWSRMSLITNHMSLCVNVLYDRDQGGILLAIDSSGFNEQLSRRI